LPFSIGEEEQTMRPHVRTYAIALVMLAAGLATSPAYAGTIMQPNACFYSVNEEFRTRPSS